MAVDRTVRVDEQTHALLAQLKEATGRSMTDLLARAVERLQDQLVLDQMNAGYAELRGDEGAWAEERRERELWDATLADGLARE